MMYRHKNLLMIIQCQAWQSPCVIIMGNQFNLYIFFVCYIIFDFVGVITQISLTLSRKNCPPKFQIDDGFRLPLKGNTKTS